MNDNRKSIARRRAAHLNAGLNEGNSYPQIGHSLLAASISIAQDGHSLVFTGYWVSFTNFFSLLLISAASMICMILTPSSAVTGIGLSLVSAS
jgi:hypothetical protein